MTELVRRGDRKMTGQRDENATVIIEGRATESKREKTLSQCVVGAVGP